MNYFNIDWHWNDQEHRQQRDNFVIILKRQTVAAWSVVMKLSDNCVQAVLATG